MPRRSGRRSRNDYVDKLAEVLDVDPSALINDKPINARTRRYGHSSGTK